MVIVIIGILSTISTATFRTYFAKARDAERVSAVQNMALMVRVDQASYTDDGKYIPSGETADNGNTGKLDLANVFTKNDFEQPSAKNDICYFYYATEGENATTQGVTGEDNIFTFTTWGEQTSSDDPNAAGPISDGAQAFYDAIETAHEAGTPTITISTYSCSQDPAAGGIFDAVDADGAKGGSNAVIFGRRIGNGSIES